ncbi:DUF3967 domain-containing protein [Bacillus kwashiorkori]|uniref:DUF3967 domain-containing protein n=1 Tax=Bacillus kwashiorkori TaxID=1522318 RepID=UPI0007840A83|nr:DUF3967 domain-containing protein [Bacillus kwashiorkori]
MQLQRQQDYIDSRLEKRDKLLMESIRESLESRKEIAAATEQKSGGNFGSSFSPAPEKLYHEKTECPFTHTLKNRCENGFFAMQKVTFNLRE